MFRTQSASVDESNLMLQHYLLRNMNEFSHVEHDIDALQIQGVKCYRRPIADWFTLFKTMQWTESVDKTAWTRANELFTKYFTETNRVVSATHQKIDDAWMDYYLASDDVEAIQAAKACYDALKRNERVTLVAPFDADASLRIQIDSCRLRLDEVNAFASLSEWVVDGFKVDGIVYYRLNAILSASIAASCRKEQIELYFPVTESTSVILPTRVHEALQGWVAKASRLANKRLEELESKRESLKCALPQQSLYKQVRMSQLYEHASKHWTRSERDWLVPTSDVQIMQSFGTRNTEKTTASQTIEGIRFDGTVYELVVCKSGTSARVTMRFLADQTCLVPFEADVCM